MNKSKMFPTLLLPSKKSLIDELVGDLPGLKQ